MSLPLALVPGLVIFIFVYNLKARSLCNAIRTKNLLLAIRKTLSANTSTRSTPALDVFEDNR